MSTLTRILTAPYRIAAQAIGARITIATLWERIGKLEHELRQDQHDNTAWLLLEAERDALRDRAEKAERALDGLDLATVQANAHGIGQESAMAMVASWLRCQPDQVEQTIALLRQANVELAQERDQQRDEARTLADEVARLKRACAARDEVMAEQTARLVLHEEVERAARQCLRDYGYTIGAHPLRDALDALAAAAEGPGRVTRREG